MRDVQALAGVPRTSRGMTIMGEPESADRRVLMTHCRVRLLDRDQWPLSTLSGLFRRFRQGSRMSRKQRKGAVVVERADHELESLLRLYLQRDDDAFDPVRAMSAYDPDQCWRFLEIARRSGLSEEDLAFLSSGPFEDMMKRHGDEFIARVEEESQSDPNMRTLVATVWRAGMRDALWDRIVALRTRLGITPL